jgi:hypothetical protein
VVVAIMVMTATILWEAHFVKQPFSLADSFIPLQ